MMITRERRWLDEDFIPSKLLFRDEQIRELEYIKTCMVDQAISGETVGAASDALLLGGPGTGKTALLRDLLARSRQYLLRSPNTPSRAAYIDCSVIGNERIFWVRLCFELGIYYTSTTSLDQLRSDVLDVLQTNNLLMLLDEIDALILDSPEMFNGISNCLSRTSGVTIVAAANRKDWKKGTTGEKNTFNPKIIHCTEYNKQQLRALAIDRLVNALGLNNRPDPEAAVYEIVERELIDIVASRAYRLGGDARKLIKMLRIAVEQAEIQQKRFVSSKDAQFAVAQIDDDLQQIADSLQQKSHDVHAVILAVCLLNEENQRRGEEKGVRSLEILERYQEIMDKGGEDDPLKYRSVMDLLQKLLTEGLVDRQRAKTRGNVWFYEINEEIITTEKMRDSLINVCDQCKKAVTAHIEIA